MVYPHGQLPPVQRTVKKFVNGFKPAPPDTFNPHAYEWTKPVHRFWKLIVEATTQEEMNKILWEADAVMLQQPPGGPMSSCEKWLRAAYQTHLYRIRHGTKTFS